VERGHRVGVFFQELVELFDGFTGGSIEQLDPFRSKEAPRLIGYDHAPEVAGSHDYDIGLSIDNFVEIRYLESVAFLSPPRIVHSIPRDDDIGGVYLVVDADPTEAVARDLHTAVILAKELRAFFKKIVPVTNFLSVTDFM
jgi:hypothetical protein